MTPCSAWQLYVIVDRDVSGGRDLAQIAAAAIRGGADVLQLREKHATDAQVCRDAERLLPLTRAAGIPLIINDRIEVASQTGADGVHLGQADPPVTEARRVLGPGRLVGKSTHSLEQALAAEAEGADCVAVVRAVCAAEDPEAAARELKRLLRQSVRATSARGL